MILPILYRDNDLVIVNKPSGLLVHRTALDRSATEFALQTLRNQIGQRVYPVHRLDRAASGALIFALSSDVARMMTKEFALGKIKKDYLAVVRGFTQAHFQLDHPLKELLDIKTDALANQAKPAQSAITTFETLKTFEFQVKIDRYPTSRYALIKAFPKTGRKHQIRRHLHHLSHPIIGDTTYGSGKHNRFFESSFKVKRLLLACIELRFTHPITNREIQVGAPPAAEFQKVLEQMHAKSLN